MRVKFFNMILFPALLLLSACSGGNAGSSPEGDDIPLKYAQLLKLSQRDGCVEATITNPWDTTKTLARYILKENKDCNIDCSGATVIELPVESSVVFSSVHNTLVSELGKGNAVTGICDVEFTTDPYLLERLEKGEIADCGLNTSPNVEKILMLNPGAVLASPYENSGHGTLEYAGVPIVECADYMENSPLARAEWMKFYGLLYGCADRADSLFKETESQYLSLKSLAGKAKDHPLVLFDRIYGSSWDAPARLSTTGLFISDAGGVNPFASIEGRGAAQLSPEKVLYEAGDADVWFVRHYGPLEGLNALKSDHDIYSRIKAFKDGKVFGTDSKTSNIFEDQAFHPQWILNDMIRVLHPELKDTLRQMQIAPRSYYSPLK